MIQKRGESQIARTLCEQFSGPLLLDYVWWVLTKARERNLNRLYFMARDGYLLKEIAVRFCKRFDLPIECRYLYASRASLRMPSYHLIGEEADELLTLGGYRVNPKSMLLRANLDKEQRMQVYDDCGWAEQDESHLLTKDEHRAFSAALRRSEVFHRFVLDKSKAAYESTIGYFRQEGLFDQKTVAIVDSGWTGSIQRSLRQLLESAGYKGSITGFYFGMYARPKSPEDGTYLTWHFDHETQPGIKIPFCNNLFECLLSAPHGMTTGYLYCDGAYAPDLLPTTQGEELVYIETNIRLVLQYVDERLKTLDFDRFSQENMQKETRRLIRRYMAHPHPDEVEWYGHSLFCDDTTEAYRGSLADRAQVQLLKAYSIPARICRRLLGVKGSAIAELYWPYGTIALASAWKRWWYWMNIYIWEWIRYVRG